MMGTNNIQCIFEKIGGRIIEKQDRESHYTFVSIQVLVPYYDVYYFATDEIQHRDRSVY
jgi:hypothetical protein